VTIGQWLAARTPAPPPELLDRVVAAFGPRANQPATELAAHAVDVAESMLERMLASGDTSRATALDLLVVDSLVTYAFEAAADEPSSIADRAQQAMQRLAALGATP
jgi:hypothetical protein